MSEFVIEAKGLAKAYRRFRSPGWRALDALGLPVSRNRYDVLWALRGVDFTVAKGERIGLIGRNGAGKSTLLRMIAGQAAPSEGVLQVRGNVQALMELGTGFHPDFSGIDNARTALSLQGMPTQEIPACIEEIIDFTELDDFIHRPVREYSAGMYARLAFAVATSISPEVLIIDEILGAGDAYFMGKSIQRMRQLTDNGATVLFVSHDMSSVQLLCDRALWIDGGHVLMDGDPLAVGKAYLARVREEDELRLRARAMSLTKGQARALQGLGEAGGLFRLVSAQDGAPAKPCWLAGLRLQQAGEVVLDLTPAGIKSTNASAELLIDPLHMNWRSPQNQAGCRAWPFGDFGGSYGHAPWQMSWSPSNAELSLELDYCSSPSTDVLVQRYEDGEYRTLATLPAGEEGWKTVHIVLSARCGVQPEGTSSEEAAEPLQALSPDERYGSGEVKITGFAFIDVDGRRRHTLVSGDAVQAVLEFDAGTEVFEPVAVVAIYRPDGTCATQLISSRDGIRFGSVQGRGRISVDVERLHLGPGDYIASVALFRELNLAVGHEPPAYDLHDRCYPLKILPPAGIAVSIGFVNQPACWAIRYQA